MIKKTILFLLVFSVIRPNRMYGQQPLQPDTAAIEIRQPADSKIADYAGDDAFNYETTSQNPESILDRIIYWLQRRIGKIMTSPAGVLFLEIALYAGFAALIIMLINQYMKGNMRSLFLGANKSNPNTFSLREESPDDMDLDRLIHDAIADDQFSLAVRYLYQKGLLQLQNTKLIIWKKNKTNRDYVYEINRGDLRDVFREVTRYYEYAEYGNFAIRSADFKKVHRRFEKMKTLIQSPV